MAGPPSVAITGAAGRIGRALVDHLAARGYPLTLIDRPGRGLEAMASVGSVVELELDRELPAGSLEGVDVVVHLAGEANPDAAWDSLLADNIQASYNVASAAERASCRRLIVASSVHAVSASTKRPVAPTDPVAPADLYGVTKCFVEALAFWCAHRGMSAAAVRIGAFQTVEASKQTGADWMADVFIAAPDLVALLERAITAEFRFAILHAAAPGRDVLLDTAATEELLGWEAVQRFPRTSEAQ
jgi:nucleoside-diphosphate-sugar epimerase